MAKTDKAKSALPYARQLLEDEYVQEQLRNAAGALSGAYDRARKRRAGATEDKRLYGNLRQAATSLRKATSALQRQEPAPKRRFRKLATLAFAVSGSVWLTVKLQRSEPVAPASSGEPVAPSHTSAEAGQASAPVASPEQAATAAP
ncbi:MAG: hypothetical protein JO130_01430 [Solirubrobacterales bacterium]|nr:hypothetical protein [Solirubrobacterales bacterium]